MLFPAFLTGDMGELSCCDNTRIDTSSNWIVRAFPTLGFLDAADDRVTASSSFAARARTPRINRLRCDHNRALLARAVSARDAVLLLSFEALTTGIDELEGLQRFVGLPLEDVRELQRHRIRVREGVAFSVASGSEGGWAGTIRPRSSDGSRNSDSRRWQ